MQENADPKKKGATVLLAWLAVRSMFFFKPQSVQAIDETRHVFLLVDVHDLRVIYLATVAGDNTRRL